MILYRGSGKGRCEPSKHGIAFHDAIHVFEDPFALSKPDRVVEGELRWQTIGVVGNILLVLVAHTIEEEADNEVVRIFQHAEPLAGAATL